MGGIWLVGYQRRDRVGRRESHLSCTARYGEASLGREGLQNGVCAVGCCVSVEPRVRSVIASERRG